MLNTGSSVSYSHRLKNDMSRDCRHCSQHLRVTLHRKPPPEGAWSGNENAHLRTHHMPCYGFSSLLPLLKRIFCDFYTVQGAFDMRLELCNVQGVDPMRLGVRLRIEDLSLPMSELDVAVPSSEVQMMHKFSHMHQAGPRQRWPRSSISPSLIRAPTFASDKV
jgi:hypothetical protein